MNTEQKKLLKQLAQMGEVILITNGNRVHLNKNSAVALKTQAHAVLYFLQRLDIDMVSSVLENNRTYQNFEKPLFIKKLGDTLDEYIESGDTFLNRYDGVCNSKTCNFNCKGFSFVGNKSNDYMDLIIEIREDKVFDIYECYDFINENDTFLKKNKISIDGLESNFNQ